MATTGGLPRVRGIGHDAHVLSAFFTPQVSSVEHIVQASLGFLALWLIAADAALPRVTVTP